jgi:uncharacterized protein YegP (UPF0339 family)
MADFPKYRLSKSSNNQYYWVLFAVNGEIILNSSETYVSKEGALNGIQSSKTNVADSNFQKLTASNAQPYFNQIASNWKIIGKSEMYNSVQSRDNGIVAVKRDAPIARIEDVTVKTSIYG